MRNPFKSLKRDYEEYDNDFDNSFYRGDEDDGVVEDETVTPEVPAAPVSRKPAGGSASLKVVKPRGYEDGPDIADHLMQGYTVVMNIEQLERTAAIRLIDFLLGTLHVLGGDLRRVTKTTLVLAPRAVEMSIEDEDGVESAN